MITVKRLLVVVGQRWTIVVMANILAFLGAIAFSQGAYADGSVTAGVITALYNNQQIGNFVFVTITGTKSSTPSCETNGSFQFVLNMSSSNPNATQMYAALLTARVSQTPISLIGDGTCPAGNTENLIVINL